MNNNKPELKNISQFLSYVLRHCPEDINLSLDTEGWAPIAELIERAQPKIQINRELIAEVVHTSDKQRFKISDDGLKIRANQGHSVKIDLKLIPQKPPSVLYHGSASRFLDSILTEGLKSGQRNHVHLSTDITTAASVGKRYGKPVILKINADKMYQQGHHFFLSENNVWLTESVSPAFLSIN